MMNWSHKPAIKWSPQREGCATTISCPYWDPDLISLLQSLDLNGDANLEDNQDDEKCSVSYGALVLAAISLVHSLRPSLDEIVRGCAPPQGVGVSIAVAIPEGPLLPLAILVVHLLNEPVRMGDSQTVAPFAVLIPLEPGEGKERLRRMLVDLCPAMILCLAGKDAARLEDILASVEPVETSVKREGLYCPARPSLVDFGELLLKAVAGKENGSFSLKQRIRDCFDETSEQESFLRVLSRCEKTNDTNDSRQNRISHIVFTSGTTGVPKGCISSIQSLRHYLDVKNEAHQIASDSKVLLASALSFDPCLSDILATFQARATLVIASRADLIQNLPVIVSQLQVTHVLCTPTMWGMVQSSGVRPTDLPSLQVVALGGEVIPKHIVHTWARDKGESKARSKTSLRLCATYGVTEACVYQTFGEVWRGHKGRGQNVGKPLRDLAVHICDESNQSSLQVVSEKMNGDSHSNKLGEIVLSGTQIDKYSGYLNREQLSAEKFVQGTPIECDNDVECENYFYRTGDRGYIDSITGDVHIIGRIHGEDGMIKVNGIRIELSEIESALIDDVLVMDCLAVDRDLNNDSKQIHAFCILSRQGLAELELDRGIASACGVVVTSGPLLLLLRSRCKERIRAGVMPSNFIIIERLPFSPTGKRDRRRLPEITECISSDSLRDGSSEGTAISLWEYGCSGATVTENVVTCLNLQPCQKSLLTTATSFGMLGGDSLAATRLVRSLYAYHHGVNDSRRLGGQYGVLDGPFAVSHLLQAKTMGEYVDWLDSRGICGTAQETSENRSADGASGQGEAFVIKDEVVVNNGVIENSTSSQLYEALLEAVALGHSVVACALLDHDGVDPNLYEHTGRLGKTSGIERRQIFRSNPLHLACSKGDPLVVKKLIEKGCNFKSPDASGSFPIHLAASSTKYNRDDPDIPTQGIPDESKDEDQRRYECVRLLLETGAPLTMKDGNKQTILHCASRSGNCILLRYLMKCWSSIDNGKGGKSKHKAGPYDWNDRWHRTPVHWAVLNGKVEALKILLDGGCTANPYKPSCSRGTSVAMESPLEICERVYGAPHPKGIAMQEILLAAGARSD